MIVDSNGITSLPNANNVKRSVMEQTPDGVWRRYLEQAEFADWFKPESNLGSNGNDSNPTKEAAAEAPSFDGSTRHVSTAMQGIGASASPATQGSPSQARAETASQMIATTGHEAGSENRNGSDMNSPLKGADKIVASATPSLIGGSAVMSMANAAATALSPAISAVVAKAASTAAEGGTLGDIEGTGDRASLATAQLQTGAYSTSALPLLPPVGLAAVYPSVAILGKGDAFSLPGALVDATASRQPVSADSLRTVAAADEGSDAPWQKRVAHAYMADDGLTIWLRDANVRAADVDAMVKGIAEWGNKAGVTVRRIHLNGQRVFERRDLFKQF